MKRISILLAFLIAISTFGIIGSACTVPDKEDVNAVTTTNVFEAVKDLYKQVTGKELPAAVADRLNDALWEEIAKGTGYLGIAKVASNLIYEHTGIILPAETLAIAIKAALLLTSAL